MAEPQPLRVIDGERESSRLHFNHKEIERVLRALELVDGADYDLAMRVLFLEDQVADIHDLAKRWRRAYAVMKDIASAVGEHQVAVLDQAMREWVGS